MLMRSSKILTLAVAFALLASFMVPIIGNGPVANAAADDPIEVKIGLLNPLTGPIDVYAPAFTDAADLAIAHLNDGQTDYQFSLVEQDSGCDGTTAATAAQSAVDAGVVGIAGAACSGATLGAMPVARDAGIPMVSYASTSPALTTADDSDFLFRVVPSDAQQGMAMASMAAQHAWTNPGLIYMTNDYGAGLAAVVSGAYAMAGQDMCVEIGYDDDTTDFSSQVAQFAEAECDSLITVTYASDGAALLEEMATQGIVGEDGGPFPVMGADGIADAGFLAAFSDPTAAAMVIATKPASGTDSQTKTDFEAAWATHYDGDDAVAIYIHETYDAITMIGEAAMDADSTDGITGAEVRDAIAALGSGNGFEGASGTHVFDSVGDVAGSGYDICQFTPTVDEDGNPTLALLCPAHWDLIEGLSFDGVPFNFKIGLLNPLTGPIDVYAPGFTLAAAVAEAYVNTVRPLTFQFEIVTADSGCDATTAATGAQTLVDAGVVGIAGAACSGATMGAIDVAAAAGVPMVSYASTSPAITNYDDNGYLFRVVPSDAQQGQALADVYGASGYEYPGIIAMTNDYGAGFHAAFKENHVANGGEVCAEATYADGTTDFSSQVAAVIDGGCDSVVMITYASDGAAIAEELASQDAYLQIFGGDGIADSQFATEFTDVWALDGVTATRPASSSPTEYQYLFDAFYAEAAAAAGFEGGIYTRETFDAIAIIALAAATATQTPADDGVKEMLGTAIAGPGAPQEGASGTHVFDENGDVAGSGYEICSFWVNEDDTVEFDCHSSWGLLEGLEDDGIPKAGDDEDECPFDDEEWCEANMQACTGEGDEGDPATCGTNFAAKCAEAGNEENEDCVDAEEWCSAGDPGGDDAWGEWDTAFCGAFTAEPEPEPEAVVGCMDNTANNYNADATEDSDPTACTFDVVEEPEVVEEEEEADEVPGFGLLSAVAAIGVVLLLRRRL